MRYAVATAPGFARRANEDRYDVDLGLGTFIVADGIGGLADAGLTAQTVVDQLPRRVSGRVSALNDPDVIGSVGVATAEVNELVRTHARYGPGTTGATVALLLVRDGQALAVHLGDSRIYLTRDGRMVRLTDDHALTPTQLTRFVGMDGPVTPGVSVHELRDGDRLLLCTDGLTAAVGEEALQVVLRSAPGPDLVCSALVDLAHASSATDDISLIAVEYGEQQAAP